MNDLDLVNKVFDLALAGTDADIAARRDALWTAGLTLIADCLLRAGPLEREKMLMGIELELRRALRDIMPIVDDRVPAAEIGKEKISEDVKAFREAWNKGKL